MYLMDNGDFGFYRFKIQERINGFGVFVIVQFVHLSSVPRSPFRDPDSHSYILTNKMELTDDSKTMTTVNTQRIMFPPFYFRRALSRPHGYR